MQQSIGEVFICQEKYIEDLLKKFHMIASKPVSTLMSSNEKLQQEDVAEKADAKTSKPCGFFDLSHKYKTRYCSFSQPCIEVHKSA